MNDFSIENLPELDLSQWTKTGEGHTAESFDSADGKTMLKLYFDFVPRVLIEEELRKAEAAYAMGLPTPKPGEMVRFGDRMGCTFSRIADKRSFARAIADEPERLEEYAFRFANLAKKLHATPCDKSVFPSYREKMTESVQNQALLNEAEKEKYLRFLNDAEDAGTCIHGDLHLGNVITDGKKDYFIDMGDFAWGNPLFDLGALYLISTIVPEERVMRNYHISRAVQRRFWELFLRHYFGADTPEKTEEINHMLLPYVSMQALIFLEHDPYDALYRQYIREVLPEMEKYM